MCQSARYDSPADLSTGLGHDRASPRRWDTHGAHEDIERGWHDALSRLGAPPLVQMMSYALGGGKCLRGTLLMAVAESCSSGRTPACAAAVAIEMLHAASLVIDDLPALDDACLRRNTLSLHKRFGEAAAILTAHSLVALAFELLTQIPSDPDRLIRIIRALAIAIGPRGMARAELIDPPTQANGANTEARDIRALKTGGLFQLAAYMGALLAGASSDVITDAAELGLRLGICYQLADDLRDDVMSEPEHESLEDENRRCWRECLDFFHSLRGRLHDAIPMESWMSRFHAAAAEAVAQ